MEIYDDIDDIRNCFEQFANQTKELVIANGDNDQVKKINYKTDVLFYGFNDDNDIVIKDSILDSEGSKFRIVFKGEDLGEFQVPLFGKHMVMNSAAAIGICHYIGIDLDIIKKALNTFKNAKRRFETTNIGDTVVIDDYAHHPTEIKATLEAVRQKYPDRKIVAVFRPNTYSRTKDFTKEFIDALEVADKVYMTEILANREKAEDYPGVGSHMILDEIPGGEMIEEDTISNLSKEIGNVVIFMGCADNSHLIEGFENILK